MHQKRAGEAFSCAIEDLYQHVCTSLDVSDFDEDEKIKAYMSTSFIMACTLFTHYPEEMDRLSNMFGFNDESYDNVANGMMTVILRNFLGTV